ncbi:MAG: hypothetical protein K2Y01_11105 [Rhabdochlamydiaceae bacterium]|nr:hypothetical protein [Rhabdochlamydiaceae bacterium]
MQVSEKSYTESPLIYLQEPLEETRNKTNAYVLQTGFANTCTPPQTKLTPSKRHPGIDNQNTLLEIFHTIELARQFAHQKEWDAAHRTLSTIQDPFWRDSGYSSCARLATNAAIVAPFQEAENIIYSFCNKIHHAKEKMTLEWTIECMLFHPRTLSFAESDTYNPIQDDHPFKGAKDSALNGRWDTARMQIENDTSPGSFWRDRGYVMLAKTAATVFLQNGKRSQHFSYPKLINELSNLIFNKDLKEQTDRDILHLMSTQKVKALQVSALLVKPTFTIKT